MKVLSLFDGMSCGQLALKKAGIKVDTYYASEVDGSAIKVTKKNFPNAVHIGDVTKWKDWDIDFGCIDLLIGGSPCQGFSYAGKQLAFDDPRSKLFFVYCDILNHIKSRNPNVKFLLENVKMKRDYVDVISSHLGVTPVRINSSLVSAQNRDRLYWANWDFSPPDDSGIVMRDILDISTATRSPEWVYSACPSPFMGMIKLAKYGNNSQGQRLYCSNGKYPSLSAPATGGAVHPFIKDGDMIGKPSLKMLSEMQNVDEDYFECVSFSQASKMLGNGWTVNVAAHIFNSLPNPPRT